MKVEAKKIITTKIKITKKTENITKKTIPKPKPSKIMVLKLGSTVFQSLGSYEIIEINIEDIQEKAVGYVIIKGKQIILLQRFR
jgi:hypothetical protein